MADRAGLDELVRGLLEDGTPKAEIARRIGVSRETISRIAARVGFAAKARHPNRQDWSRVREFYESGNSAAACQARFGISASAWSPAVARGEIVPRPRPLQLRPGKTGQAVAGLLEEGLTVTEIADRLDISKPTVCYHARKLGVPSRSEFAHRYDWGEIRRAYEFGMSMRECKRRFGFSSDAWAEAVRRGEIAPRSRLIPLETLLVVGRRTSRTHLKARLLRAGLKENRCEACGIDEWEGAPLAMQLHHRNGHGQDNRLENLELLCPNCHSQTENYGGRNGHRRAGGPSAHRLAPLARVGRATGTEWRWRSCEEGGG